MIILQITARNKEEIQEKPGDAKRSPAFQFVRYVRACKP